MLTVYMTKFYRHRSLTLGRNIYEPDSSFHNDLFALGGNRTVHRQVLHIDTSNRYLTSNITFRFTGTIAHCIST